MLCKKKRSGILFKTNKKVDFETAESARLGRRRSSFLHSSTLSLLLTSPPSFLTPPLFQGFSPNFSPEVDRPGSLPFSGVPFHHRRALLMDADGGTGAADVIRAIAAALDWRSPPETRNAAVAFLESVSSISSTLCAYEEGKGGNPNCYG